MSAIVFLGPSLPRDEAAQVLDATFMPPAGQGDVYLAARRKPWAIGIIDGYFKHVPAVWHKEILWAMSQGVHVFGAASMGALRAAELDDFGMVGVGWVYEQFAAGHLEDDDEVTIMHGAPESGYPAFSEAMVNIRATLTAAVGEAVIERATADRLLALAKATHYADRSYERLLAADAHEDVAWLERLHRWLPEGRVDQKRLDALALLKRLDELAPEGERPAPLRPSFSFQHTDAWEQVRREIRLRSLRDARASSLELGDAVLNELRLEGAGYLALRERALVHALSQELAASSGEEADRSLLAGALEAFRLQHGLTEPNSVQPWLAEQGLNVSALTRALREQLVTDRFRALFDGELERALIEQLRLAGRYRGLLERAMAKQELLASRGLTNPALRDVALTEETLWAWFADRLGLDKEAFEASEYAHTVGFRSGSELQREVLREWCFERHAPDSS